MKQLTKKETNLLNQVVNQPDLIRTRIIQEWNAERPHFGGQAGHRYQDGGMECVYCNRPKNWKARNVFFNPDGTESK